MTQMPHPNFIDTDTLTGEMHPIRRAVLSLGSNMGDRRANLQGGIDTLKDTPEVWLTDVSTDALDILINPCAIANAVDGGQHLEEPRREVNDDGFVGTRRLALMFTLAVRRHHRVARVELDERAAHRLVHDVLVRGRELHLRVQRAQHCVGDTIRPM